MWLKDFRKDTKAMSKVAISIIIVVILLLSTFAAYVLYFSNEDKEVADGNTISINYYGTVNINGVDYVFDTSMWKVASDNDTYPKCAWFSMKSKTAYTEYSFTVGRGTVITGFDLGVIGMEEGDTKTITVTPDQGYGELVASKLTSFNLTQSVPVYVTTTASGFNSTFGVLPSNGLTVIHPIYGWPATVIDYNTYTNTVVYRNAPLQGSNYVIYGSEDDADAGWNITVSSVDTTVSPEGLITFTHDLVDSDSYMHIGYDKNGDDFILINVDTVNGTADMSYNSALAGLTVKYIVTVNSIE